jgi:hypothetical protein
MAFIPYVAAMTIALFATVTARAQDARTIRQSCQTDYETFCSGGEDDPVPLKVACLKQSYINLSDSCKSALRSQPEQEEQR